MQGARAEPRAGVGRRPGAEPVDRVGAVSFQDALNLKSGSAYICDGRVIHRGTPNRSDHARMELDIGYHLSWYDPRNHTIRMAARDFEGLSERGKQLLSRSRRMEALN